jgi:hypothetical protein
MESVQTIGASVGAPLPFIARPASPPVVQAVATDLPPAQTVTATDTAAPTANNTQSSSANDQTTVFIDPATREVVMRVVDQRSGQVVQQIPDQAMLRMQAYSQALNEGKTPTQALSMIDFET